MENEKSTSHNREDRTNPPTKSKFFPISAIILIISILIYRYVTFGPFAPLQCQLLGIGCFNTTVQGYVAPEFINAKEAFKKNFDNGDDIGASVAAYYNGKLVLDLQGGYADLETMREYDKNTLQPVFSSTKVLSSIVIAYLVDKGILNYNEKITKYWPEFAQGNKENVTLLDLVNHRAGLSYIDARNITIVDLEDLDKFAEILAAQPHSFGGVPKRAYHAITRGWYLNEIVRRVDSKHRTIGKIASEEILNQYDLEFYLSLPPNLISRVAKFYETSFIKEGINMFNTMIDWWTGKLPSSFFLEYKNKESVFYKTAQNMIGPFPHKFTDASKLEFVTIEWPSTNGITNAKSMAKLGAIIVNNGQPIKEDSSSSSFRSKSLLSKSTIELISTKLPVTFDYVLYGNFTPALGGFAYLRFPGIEDVEFMGWGGYGGSIFIWNQELGISFGYAMNGLWTPKYNEIGDRRGQSILKEIVNAVKKLKEEQT
ncbi:beta-lactamase/transpeptidase-like protein [Gigaspora margarita]|uniref:Beta-lactamase/transpeptidase-like protein n=1 Tax=Gigaspora margarita TaxID=4874 RepID=A0A8H4AX07_GIGMA|nr:beta-lactamase/transpeptidase-like protein [Gigaspora margarita]